MAAIQLSLLGQIPVELYESVQQRLTRNSQVGEAFERKEILFERGARSSTINDDNMLRLRGTRAALDNKVTWVMQVLQKPESARLSPEALQRSVIECTLTDGEPVKFVSSLGYREKTTLIQKGVRFEKGSVQVEVFQYFNSMEAKEALDSSSYFISVFTRYQHITRGGGPNAVASATIVTSAQDLRSQALDNLRQMAAILRGLVDLKRVD